MDSDVACSGFLEFDIAAARAGATGAIDIASSNVARAGLSMNIAGESTKLHVTRAAFEIDAALEAIDIVISGTAMRPQRGFSGRSDFVVNGHVAHVDVVNAHAVPVLAHGRIFLDFFHLGLLVAAEKPRGANVDLAYDLHGSGGPTTHHDVAGVREGLELNRTIHLKSFLKGSVYGGETYAGRKQEHETDRRETAKERDQHTRVIHSVAAPQVSFLLPAGRDTCQQST